MEHRWYKNLNVFLCACNCHKSSRELFSKSECGGECSFEANVYMPQVKVAVFVKIYLSVCLCEGKKTPPQKIIVFSLFAFFLPYIFIGGVKKELFEINLSRK